MTESYECFELSDDSACEEPNCSCDCHDDQDFSVFYGWQDREYDDDGYEQDYPAWDRDAEVGAR